MIPGTNYTNVCKTLCATMISWGICNFKLLKSLKLSCDSLHDNLLSVSVEILVLMVSKGHFPFATTHVFCCGHGMASLPLDVWKSFTCCVWMSFCTRSMPGNGGELPCWKCGIKVGI